MTVEDEVRKCCKEIESIRHDAEKLKKRADTDEHLARWEHSVEPFVQQARDAGAKLEREPAEGLQKLVDGWRSARDRLAGHLRLIEAKSFLTSARRLAGQDDFVGAQNELGEAVRDVREARPQLSEHDFHLEQVAKAVEQAAAELSAKAGASIGAIEKAVERTNSLLDQLHRTS
jgi:septation ring formation regulator EzrA